MTTVWGIGPDEWSEFGEYALSQRITGGDFNGWQGKAPASLPGRRNQDVMAINTLSDLFEHGVKDIYYAEKELLDALETLASQSTDEAISEAFESHREETKEHVSRLEDVFEEMGQEPAEEECEGIDGLIKEHEDFASEDPDQELLNLHNLVAAKKTERYEITAYEDLVNLADRLDMTEVGDLLEQNLSDEEDALEKLSSMAKEYNVSKGAVPSD